MSANRTNVNGTTADDFRIGKRGPTIRQGTTDPNLPSVRAGVSGDLYVRTGNAPRLYQFDTAKWIDISSDLRMRRVVEDASALIDIDDTYVGVRYVGDCALTLPQGREGLKIVVKDEVGREANGTITVSVSGTDTIDAQTSVTLYSRDSLTLFYGAEWHII